MYQEKYFNFVRPTSVETSTSAFFSTKLNGETARKLYLEEVGNLQTQLIKHNSSENNEREEINHKRKRKPDETEISNLQLFQCVQNDDVDKLRQALDICPDKINIVDEFGWSLLMIACQANSIETVKELLKRGIDRNIRDKAGNSAQTLVIKNKNFILADILLTYRRKINTQNDMANNIQIKNKKTKEKYACKICDNKIFENKQEHLSSTIHNLNASKGRKIPTNYIIPESNKGYQIMLKVGWDKETGLGPDGSGKMYPIRAVQKNDKKGLGHKKNKRESSTSESLMKINKKMLYKEHDRHRRIEINFRREFY